MNCFFCSICNWHLSCKLFALNLSVWKQKFMEPLNWILQFVWKEILDMPLNFQKEIYQISYGVFPPDCSRGGGRFCPPLWDTGTGRFWNFDQFWNNTPNDTSKKAQNPKDEVSSSKTDEMAKVWNIVAKTRKWNIFKNWEICAM